MKNLGKQKRVVNIVKNLLVVNKVKNLQVVKVKNLPVANAVANPLMSHQTFQLNEKEMRKFSMKKITSYTS